jgi:hypothetical protein
MDGIMDFLLQKTTCTPKSKPSELTYIQQDQDDAKDSNEEELQNLL